MKTVKRAAWCTPTAATKTPHTTNMRTRILFMKNPQEAGIFSQTLYHGQGGQKGLRVTDILAPCGLLKRQTPRQQMKNLKDRIAVVTGASSGVGKALAHELARRGARVLLPARDPQKLRRVSEELEPKGAAARHWALDLTN